MNQFAEYVAHGWKLCPIEPGSKGPRTAGWNLEANAVKDPSNLQGAGLLHAYSKTCALDIDRMDDAAAYLAQHNINLADLLADPAAVQIVSGRPNRGKLLYGLPTPVTSFKLTDERGDILDFRCRANTGKSVQDVLPPTVHPDTGNPYKWMGDWRCIPPIPAALLALWKSLVVSESRDVRTAAASTANHPELTALLAKRDPSCGYDEWLKCGMALHHEGNGHEDYLAIWDAWSAPSDKYPGLQVLQSHWQSFGRSASPITVDYLRRSDRVLPTDFEDVSGASDVLEAPPPAKPAFQFLSLLELFNRPEPEWIIEGILPEAAFGAIYGQPSAGKTFTAVDIALSIGLGQPWRGRPVKQGAVLYIAAEDDRGVQVRFAAGLASRGVPDAPIRVLPTAPVLTDKAQSAALLEAIKREKRPAIIFFDTLAAVTPGADENSVKDMNELVSYCYRIHKATGALVMLIHHEGKTAGRGMRGSSVLPGATEVIWEVSKDEQRHELRIEKLKNWELNHVYGFRLQPVANSCIVEWI